MAAEKKTQIVFHRIPMCYSWSSTAENEGKEIYIALKKSIY